MSSGGKFVLPPWGSEENTVTTAADPFNLDDVLKKYAKKPSEVSHPELLLLYSRPGGGKTWLAATISEVPGVNKTLILDTEGSTHGTLTGFDDDKIDIIPCRKDSKVESFQFLNTILDRLFDSTTAHTYDAVVIDTFDVAQDWAHAYYDATAPTSRSGEKDGFAVWGSVKQWSLDTAASLKRIKPYGLLVVHDREEKTKDGAIETRLNLLGSARDVLPGIPDTVAYLQRVVEGENSEEVTYGYFASQDGKVTKNRFHFPPVVRSPTLPALFQFIDKQKGGDKK